MHKQQVIFGALTGAAYLVLSLTTVTKAQTAHDAHDVINIKQSPHTEHTDSQLVTGVIDSLAGMSLSVRLSDGSLQTYSAMPPIFNSLNLNKGTVIIFDANADIPVSKGGRPIQAFNGRIIEINSNQLTVMLTDGQIRNIPIQTEFAVQLRQLQRSPDVAQRIPITGIVNDTHPLSGIDYKPSTATTAPTPQIAARIRQARDAKVTYSDLISACRNPADQVNRLQALQDISNNVVELNRIEIVDINELLKGRNVETFHQQHLNHTKAQRAMLGDTLQNISVIVPNTNQIMPLDQALSLLKVKSASVVNISILDPIYGKVFVLYDSTAQ